MEKLRFMENIDPSTPISLQGEKVRVDWYRAGEGWNGDYNPEDPTDEELLRYDVYYRQNETEEWEAVDDASYCTYNRVDTPIDILKGKLLTLYNEFADVLTSDPNRSVKKLGEALSWI